MRTFRKLRKMCQHPDDDLFVIFKEVLDSRTRLEHRLRDVEEKVRAAAAYRAQPSSISPAPLTPLPSPSTARGDGRQVRAQHRLDERAAAEEPQVPQARRPAVEGYAATGDACGWVSIKKKCWPFGGGQMPGAPPHRRPKVSLRLTLTQGARPHSASFAFDFLAIAPRYFVDETLPRGARGPPHPDRRRHHLRRPHAPRRRLARAVSATATTRALPSSSTRRRARQQVAVGGPGGTRAAARSGVRGVDKVRGVGGKACSFRSQSKTKRITRAPSSPPATSQ